MSHIMLSIEVESQQNLRKAIVEKNLTSVENIPDFCQECEDVKRCINPENVNLSLNIYSLLKNRF